MCCGWSRREEKSNTHTHTVSSSGCQVCSVTWTCDQLHCSSCSNTYLGTIRSLLSVTDQLCKITLYSPPLSPSTHIIYEKRNNGGLGSCPPSTIRHQYQPLIMAQQPLFRFVVAVTAWEVEFVGPFGTTSCYDRGGWATDATSEHLFFSFPPPDSNLSILEVVCTECSVVLIPYRCLLCLLFMFVGERESKTNSFFLREKQIQYRSSVNRQTQPPSLTPRRAIHTLTSSTRTTDNIMAAIKSFLGDKKHQVRSAPTAGESIHTMGRVRSKKDVCLLSPFRC